MQPSTLKLRFYNNSTMGVLGKNPPCITNIKGVNYHLIIKIIKEVQKNSYCQGPPVRSLVLSLSTMWTQSIVRMIPFHGVRSLDGDYHIEVDQSIKPVQYLPQRVSLALKTRQRARIHDKKVIPLISRLITVVKPDKLRICIDPEDLTKAIKHPKNQMLILDEPWWKKIFSIRYGRQFLPGKINLDEYRFYCQHFGHPVVDINASECCLGSALLHRSFRTTYCKDYMVTSIWM